MQQVVPPERSNVVAHTIVRFDSSHSNITWKRIEWRAYAYQEPVEVILKPISGPQFMKTRKSRQSRDCILIDCNQILKIDKSNVWTQTITIWKVGQPMEDKEVKLFAWRYSSRRRSKWKPRKDSMDSITMIVGGKADLVHFKQAKWNSKRAMVEK